MTIIDDDSFVDLSGKFVSKLRTHLHSSAKAWANDLKALLAGESGSGTRTYAGRRYFFPLPKIPAVLQNFAGELYRYLSRNSPVTEPFNAMEGLPDVRSTEMARGQLIRS